MALCLAEGVIDGFVPSTLVVFTEGKKTGETAANRSDLGKGFGLASGKSVNQAPVQKKKRGTQEENSHSEV